ncbi:hypothetical protein [Zavarzinella formosa]|uniref:hypothetical protein n=1 Tax=Zavarzinella formosa TaxID=360055 RepID=UPI000319D647|nr:hypothetical protein [Zavarzinella formosa]
MPLIHELKGSRNLSIGRDGASAPWLFMVREAADEAAAYQLADQTSPASYQPVPGITGVLLKSKIETQDMGAGIYVVTVNYDSGQATDAGDDVGANPTEPAGGPGDTGQGGGNPAGDTDPDADLGREFTFTTGSGATEHITRAKSLTESGKKVVGPAQAAPDVKLAIGVSKEGVAGVDIVAPVPEFAYTTKLSYFTIGRFIRLCWATGKMNLNPWFGLGAFEVLFLGCDGKYSDSDKSWSITYRFKYSATERAIDILGDNTLVVAEKPGHDYLWVAYDAADVDGEFRIQLPTAYYVHRVYEPIDFKTHLGIGL